MALNFLLSAVCKQCLAQRLCLLHMFTPWHDLAAGWHYCSVSERLVEWTLDEQGSCVTGFASKELYFSGAARNRRRCSRKFQHTDTVAYKYFHIVTSDKCYTVLLPLVLHKLCRLVKASYS